MKAMTIPQIHPDRTIRLTKRELEVLNLVIEGKSSKEVADELFVSKRTVDFHLANIYEKLQVSNRVQAFRRATSLGLIPLDSTGLRSA
ncbi:MAG: helix-turn-helix domain-containing protein [Armatimonadota bacterium]